MYAHRHSSLSPPQSFLLHTWLVFVCILSHWLGLLITHSYHSSLFSIFSFPAFCCRYLAPSLIFLITSPGCMSHSFPRDRRRQCPSPLTPVVLPFIVAMNVVIMILLAWMRPAICPLARSVSWSLMVCVRCRLRFLSLLLSFLVSSFLVLAGGVVTWDLSRFPLV